MCLLAGLLLCCGSLIAGNPPPAYADDGLARLRICRINVTPCQSNVNLLINNEVDLGLYLEPGPGLPTANDLRLAGWEFYLGFVGDGLVKPALLQQAVKPVLEPDARQPARKGAGSPKYTLPVLQPEGAGYYVAHNRMDNKTRQIDYAAVMVNPNPGSPPEQAASGLPALNPWPTLLLGQIRIKGTRNGVVHLVTAGVAGQPSQVVLQNESGELAAETVETEAPLAVINVGRGQEKARMQGRVWTQGRLGQGKRMPYRAEFSLTFWQPGAVPPWLGGNGKPTAIYAGLTLAENGSFTLRDLNASILPSGVYALRVHGANTLSYLLPQLEVDTGHGDAAALPRVIRVNLGPLAVGDLNGDELVDRADLEILKPWFGKEDGDPGFQVKFDLTGDEIVDSQDFSLLAANLGRVGE